MVKAKHLSSISVVSVDPVTDLSK
jgi:hypothetical protein